MTWDKGFNFRDTAVYVTDDVDETYVLDGADGYPKTRNGVTFGWTAGGASADRNASLDARLAGINYQLNDGTQATFQVDLPLGGDYTIRLAVGDAGFAQGYQYVRIKDGANILLTIDNATGTASSHFIDATTADYTDVTWPASNTPLPLTFAGSTLTVVIGSPTAQANSSTIAHLFVSQGGAGASNVVTRNRRLATQQRMTA